MRKFLIPLAAAASTLALATPASATFFPQPSYGYGQGYGYNHGRAYGHARALQVRVDRIQREIRRLAHYRVISPAEYRRLNRDSRRIEYSLRRNARDGYGLHPREAYLAERQIARLEYRLARDVRDGRRHGYGYGYPARW